MNKDSEHTSDSIRRGVYILPNLLTSGCLFMGFYSLVSTYTGSFEKAAMAIIGAAIFDGLDGRVARATGTTTRFGVEYDSLADVIAFGAAPAFLVYGWALSGFGRWGWMASFLFCICGALRLARFNVQVNTVEKGKFNGLPIPAAAICVASIVILFCYIRGSGSFKHITVLLTIYVLAFLMVSTIKFNSFKDLGPFRRRPFNTLVVFVFLGLLLLMEPQVMIFLIISGYIISGPIGELYRVFWSRGKKAEEEIEIDGNDA
ncbi:MAG: CDP-diacylglycerol--serine O-phosphatidyltransferase [Syntrophorhabdaceae bacterium]|nr:CDP-diacylglycerol--serine O-phosphatidyltransferase [Syntrophorhabdaceae bacterium]